VNGVLKEMSSLSPNDQGWKMLPLNTSVLLVAAFEALAIVFPLTDIVVPGEMVQVPESVSLAPLLFSVLKNSNPVMVIGPENRLLCHMPVERLRIAVWPIY
jgi:hypothetical protein